MFYLRVIVETRENANAPFEQTIENFTLGTTYSELRKGITKEFDQFMKADHPEVNIEDINALLIGNVGGHYFINKNTDVRHYDYFIMTDGGKTYERL